MLQYNTRDYRPSVSLPSGQRLIRTMRSDKVAFCSSTCLDKHDSPIALNRKGGRDKEEMWKRRESKKKTAMRRK